MVIRKKFDFQKKPNFKNESVSWKFLILITNFYSKEKGVIDENKISN